MQVQQVIITALLVLGIQQSGKLAKGASWNSKIEDWLNGNAKPYVLTCQLALMGNQLASSSLAQETGNTDQLKRCDNNLLIIKKDVCPTHGNAFPVCT